MAELTRISAQGEKKLKLRRASLVRPLPSSTQQLESNAPESEANEPPKVERKEVEEERTGKEENDAEADGPELEKTRSQTV